jgi:1,4-alpha-glucan branching enzyme
MASDPIGSFSFVLHSHLPYVIAHGKWPHGMDWLNEAAAETYIPLLDMLNQLSAEGVEPKLTIGITPVLCEQLADETFKREFEDYLDMKIRAAREDEVIFRRYGNEQLANLAVMWQDHYRGIRRSFLETYDRDLVAAFRSLLDRGYLDIVTCGATHGYFPLLSQDISIQAQVKVALRVHERHFRRRPRGIWLPECAYRPRYEWRPPVESRLGNKPYLRKGVDEFLSENGLDFFFVDSATLKGGKAIGVYVDRFEALKRLWAQYEKEFRPREEEVEKSPYEVYLVSSSPEAKRPVAVFTRDPRTGLQVWSGEWGYPGDGWYLEFHKKHFPGGHRYWRVTSAKSDLADKQVYEPARVVERLEENSSHFVWLVETILEEHRQQTGREGILVAPFDAELFGHWWFEGPRFMKLVLRKCQQNGRVRVTTCSEELDRRQPVEVISLPEGSWGEGGYHFIWLNEDTVWTWRHIYDDELRMIEMVQGLPWRADPRLKLVLEQAARELLLLQASDWQFLISTFAARDYAEVRFQEHHEAFNRIGDLAEKIGRGEEPGSAEWQYFEDCRQRDSLFPDLDLEWWERLEYPPS